MNNPKTEDVVEALRRCSLWKRGDCQSCPMKDIKRDEQNGVVFCAGNLMLFAADLIEQLQQELIDERYRHDRLQDFCVAQGEELARLKVRQRWIPATERLPGESGRYLIRYRLGTDILCYEVLKTKGKWKTRYLNVTHWMPLPEPPKEDKNESNPD